MKSLVMTSLILLMSSQVLGFGLVVQGEGNLVLDPDTFHIIDSYDFNRDGLPDLVQQDGFTFSVRNLDGSTPWSVTVDTLEVCPDCTDPDGYWDMTFQGFVEVEPGQLDCVVEYSYSTMELGGRGVLVVATGDGSIRYHLHDVGFDFATDLDGDGYQEIACGFNRGGSGAFWQVWGYNGVTSVASQSPRRLQVDQNYPNPFNPKTTVRFELAAASSASVEVHDAAGYLVYQRSLGELQAGEHKFTWQGIDSRGARLASGTYLVTVVAGSERQIQKMMLLK